MCQASEARGVTWRLADASPHEDASITQTGPCSGDRKRSHLGTMLLILRVCVNNGLYLRKLEVRLPLCLQSVQRRLEQCPQWLVVALFVFGVHFLSQLVVSDRSGCDLQLRQSRSGRGSKRVFSSHLTVDHEGTVTRRTVSATTSRGAGRTTCSWKLHHVCSRRASL